MVKRPGDLEAKRRHLGLVSWVVGKKYFFSFLLSFYFFGELDLLTGHGRSLH